MKLLSILPLFLLSIFSCNDAEKKPEENTTTTATKTPKPVELKPQFEIVAQYIHNTTAFTEGLEYVDSTLYESTGEFGTSKLAKVNLKTGADVQKIDIDKKYFGEGCTVLNDKVYMVTYQTEKGFVFDKKTFNKLSEFSYKGEGWGLTNNGKQIIMSNGSNILSFRNASSFKEEKQLKVFTQDGQPVNQINELELVDSFIYANVWQTNLIIKIDINTGKVASVYDLNNIYNQYIANTPGIDVMNGIAYNKTTKTFYITGKKWPILFEMKLN